MDALQVNPLLVKRAMMHTYFAINDADYEAEFQRVLNGAEEFQTHDDSKYVATLDESQATSYANHVRAFADAIVHLKKVPTRKKAFSVIALANTVALWKLLSDFRSLNGDDSK